MAYPEVWVNGKFVGGWAYGYASFRLDLTPFIEFGRENVIAVRLDNPPESSRWYPGSGIYRNVWLVKTPSIHIAQFGTYITTPNTTTEAADVSIKINLDNDGSSSEDISIRSAVYKFGSTVPVASSETKTSSPPGSRQPVESAMKIKNPALWSIDSPNLY